MTLAVRNGLADVYAEPAKDYLQDKRDAGAALAEEEWQAIHANFHRSLDIAPANPAILRELGRLHRIQVQSDELDQTEIERHGALALDYYAQAASLRPTWPWNWSSDAEVRYELYQDASDAYHQALILAAHFGPWEGLVQRTVVELGIDSWPDLSPDARQAVLAMVDRALQRQPERLMFIVDSEQSWATLCQATLPVAATGPDKGEFDKLSHLQQHCAELEVG